MILYGHDPIQLITMLLLVYNGIWLTLFILQIIRRRIINFQNYVHLSKKEATRVRIENPSSELIEIMRENEVGTVLIFNSKGVFAQLDRRRE